MSEDFTIREQNIILKSRNSLVVTGIKSVDSFDETFIRITTVDDCFLNIEGNNIVIKDVNLEKSAVEAYGDFHSFYYDVASSKKQKKRFLSYFGDK